jgi:hypothetical protein
MIQRLLVIVSVLVVGTGTVQAQTLEGFAALPSGTFAPGPTSGQFIAPANEVMPPFAAKQPVQGVSSVLRAPNGDFLVMSDNGFGSKPTSPDYVLRVYRISPDFQTAQGGSGHITVKSFFTLRDPDKKLGFALVADGEFYPDSNVPVDPAIRANRWLTGGDFDIESFRQAHDGTLWFGDEFGPFLIHTDATGKVLEAEFPLPGVKSPQNPYLKEGETPNLLGSRGFEGMAIAPNGKTLYPMLEGSLTSDPDQRRLIINEFDLGTRKYTGKQWFYRLDAEISTGQAIGDFTEVMKDTFLVIERDGQQGEPAQFKRIFSVNLNDLDALGFLVKHEVADLLQIQNPHKLADGKPVFEFPFVTIESVIPLNRREIGVLNDNNYPFSNGRTTGKPDNNEFIIIRLPEPLQ